MKTPLPVLVISVSPTSHAVPPLVKRQSRQDLRGARNAGCANNAGTVLNDPGGNNANALPASANFNKCIYRASFARIKKKRFG
jgi:hypothetical protein